MTRITLPRRALGAAALATLARPAFAQATPIRIGELNSYSRMAAFAVPYRNAMQLAQDAVNAAGGVMGGRPMELVFRDDGSTPGDAVRVAEELLTRLFHEETVRVFEAQEVVHNCPEDWEKVGNMLRTLGRAEVYGVLKDKGAIVIRDDLANHEYRFDKAAVDALFSNVPETPPSIH